MPTGRQGKRRLSVKRTWLWWARPWAAVLPPPCWGRPPRACCWWEREAGPCCGQGSSAAMTTSSSTRNAAGKKSLGREQDETRGIWAAFGFQKSGFSSGPTWFSDYEEGAQIPCVEEEEGVEWFRGAFLESRRCFDIKDERPVCAQEELWRDSSF